MLVKYRFIPAQSSNFEFDFSRPQHFLIGRFYKRKIIRMNRWLPRVTNELLGGTATNAGIGWVYGLIVSFRIEISDAFNCMLESFIFLL